MVYVRHTGRPFTRNSYDILVLRTRIMLGFEEFYFALEIFPTVGRRAHTHVDRPHGARGYRSVVPQA